MTIGSKILFDLELFNGNLVRETNASRKVEKNATRDESKILSYEERLDYQTCLPTVKMGKFSFEYYCRTVFFPIYILAAAMKPVVTGKITFNFQFNQC